MAMSKTKKIILIILAVIFIPIILLNIIAYIKVNFFDPELDTAGYRISKNLNGSWSCSLLGVEASVEINTSSHTAVVHLPSGEMRKVTYSLDENTFNEHDKSLAYGTINDMPILLHEMGKDMFSIEDNSDTKKLPVVCKKR